MTTTAETKRELEISAEDIAALANDATDFTLRFWSSLDERHPHPVTTSGEMNKHFGGPWPETGIGRKVLDDLDVIAGNARIGNARFFGYVFGSGEPVGAVGEAVSAALNQNVSAWRSSPAAATIERNVVGWIASAIGCEGFTGTLCGGGSTANLMGLAMAREAKRPVNESGGAEGVVYASEHVHMSIPKAVALLGLGRRNLRRIPADAAHRMRMDLLREAIAADRAAGLTPLAIVSSAGTVVSGAIDPMADIADIARDEGLWMHVDGAFGALAAIAEPAAFEGMGRADSLSLDAHKWLYQPVDCGCLIHRHPDVARIAFAASDSYVSTFVDDPIEGYAFFEESVELSRRFRALKLWFSLRYHGRAAYTASIATDLRLARLLGSKLEAHPDIELLAPVALSAVCFRHRRADNKALMQRVLARGRVYISNATVDGAFALRACFVNHRTTEEDVDEIIREVVEAAAELGG